MSERDCCFCAQETADGHLVVLHDLQSVLRVSEPHAINAEAVAALRASVTNLDAAQVKVRCQLPHWRSNIGLIAY